MQWVSIYVPTTGLPQNLAAEVKAAASSAQLVALAAGGACPWALNGDPQCRCCFRYIATHRWECVTSGHGTFLQRRYFFVSLSQHWTQRNAELPKKRVSERQQESLESEESSNTRHKYKLHLEFKKVTILRVRRKYKTTMMTKPSPSTSCRHQRTAAAAAAELTQRLVLGFLCFIAVLTPSSVAGAYCYSDYEYGGEYCYYDGNECNAGSVNYCDCSTCASYTTYNYDGYDYTYCSSYTAVVSCSCYAGYGGSACELTYCTAGDCNNRASSVSGFRPSCTCSCYSGYGGSACELTYCTAGDCNNRASSVSGFRPSCACSCYSGYGGSACESTYCTVPADCNNRASSVSGFRSNCACSCNAEWTGTACELSNVCTNADCNNHAVSVSGNRPYCSCTCSPEWTGPACAASNVCTNADCNYRATSTTGNRPDCTCTCAPEWTGAKCELSNLCTSADCGARIVSVSGNRPSCACVCEMGWGSSPSCSCNQTKYCDAPGTIVVAGSDPHCGCICRKGFAGPRCQRTSSMTQTLTLSDSGEVTQSNTRNRKLSATLSISATSDPASTTHTVSPSYSPTQSPSLDGLSATMSATDTFTFSRNRNSSTAAVSYSHSQSDDITSSKTCSSSLSLTRSQSEDVTYSRTYSSSNSFTRSQSSTQSATETAPLSETASLSWSTTHTANSSITLSVTSSPSISKTSTLSCTSSSTLSLSPTLSRTPSSTITISMSTSASRRSFTFEASSSESASNSLTDSPTTTSSHTPTLTVASARITSSLSCTTASRVSIRTDYEDLVVNATSSPPKKTSASVPRCSPLLKALAEAALSNKTILPCVPLYGGVSGTMLTSPGSRGPDPPFILAIAFELDANWQVRLTTNSSALLVADDTKNSTLLDNTTLLTTTSGTLFILIEATPAWMSRTSVPIEAVCGFHSYMTEFVVAWPQKQLGIADQVIVGLVSGGGVLTGNPTAAAALAMVGMLSCSGSTPAAQSAGFFVSLFFSVGPAAVGLGNLGLIFAILALHYCIVRVWMWYKAVDEDVATSDMRFPAVGVFLAMFLLPGAVYGGVVCVSSGEDVGIGVVVLILVLALAISSQVYLVKYVLPISEFEPYPCPHPTALAVEKLALLPSARWMPESSERRFTPLMGTRTKDWSTLSIADLLLALCLSSATGLGVGSNGASCSVMPIIVAVVYLGNAAVIIILRPHRRPMDRATFPLIWSLLGTLCLLKYLVVAEVLSDGMQLGLSTLQLWQTVCAVWVFFRERQWQATVSQSTSGRLFDDVVKKSTDDHNDVDDEDIFFDLNIEEDVDNDDHIAEEGGSLEDARTSNDSFSSPSSAHQSFVGGEFDLLHNYNNAESSSSSFGGGLNLLLRRTTSSITSTFSRATASFRRHSISINKKNSNNDTLREFYDLIGEGSSFSNQHNKGNNEGGGNDELIITTSSVENPILKALLAAEAPDAAVTSLHTSGGGPSRRHRSESTASNRSRYTQHVVDNLNEAGDTSNNEQQQIHLFDDNVAAIDEQERRRAQHPALIVEQQRLRSGSHVSFVQGGTNHRTEQF